MTVISASGVPFPSSKRLRAAQIRRGRRRKRSRKARRRRRRRRRRRKKKKKKIANGMAVRAVIRTAIMIS